MFDVLLVLVAVSMATLSIRALSRLDHLAREFRAYAQANDKALSDVLSSIAGHQSALDKHQQILRADVLATCTCLLLSVLCLSGVVVISW